MAGAPAYQPHWHLQLRLNNRLSSALTSIKDVKRHAVIVGAPIRRSGAADMISLADCIAMCGLTGDEVLAIAEHEHIPEIAAAALAQYLLSQDQGPEIIRDMIRDDIRQAPRTP
jgi:hypothetical protein